MWERRQRPWSLAAVVGPPLEYARTWSRSLILQSQPPQFEHLVLHSMIVDDLDCSPLLDLGNLRELQVMATRGMRPTHAQLAAAIPALQPLR